jgi:competence protein ComEA
MTNTKRTLTLLAVSIFSSGVSPMGVRPMFAGQRPQPVTQAQPAGDLLDINTATPAQLNTLPGFGPAYTRRVIEGRPYTAKNQLVTRGVLPKSAYELVSSRIIAHRVAR